MQVEPSPILTPVQEEIQSYYKNTIYIGNLNTNVRIEDIYDIFGLKSTAYLRINCHVGFPLNPQTQKGKGHVYIAEPKNVRDKLEVSQIKWRRM